MPELTVTTATGSTVSINERDGNAYVVLDHAAAPDDMRHLEAGRVVDGGFQPAPFSAYGLSPTTLRAIADLLELRAAAAG